MGEASDGADVAPVSWATARGGAGGSGCVGGEEMELRAGEAVTLFVWAAICGSEGSSSEVGGVEMELGARAGEMGQG